MAKENAPKTKAQIIAAIAEKAGITKVQGKVALETLVELAYAGAADNGFTVPGLGKLVLAQRKARKGRNPLTGASIMIPARTVVKFRIAKAAKDGILACSAPCKAKKCAKAKK